MMIKKLFKSIYSSCIVQISQTLSRPMFKYIVFIQPFFYTLMLSMIYSNATLDQYISYVIIGTGAITLWSSVIFSSASDIDREKFIGTLTYIYTTSTDFSIIILGKIIGNTLLGMFSMFISSGLLILFSNHTIIIPSFPYLFFGILLIFFTYISMAFFLCLLFTLSREIRIFMNFFIYPMYILCGAVFPIDILPLKIRILSYLIPSTWALKIIRNSFENYYEINDIIIVVTLLIMYNVFNYIFLQKFYRTVKIKGTLEVA